MGLFSLFGKSKSQPLEFTFPEDSWEGKLERVLREGKKDIVEINDKVEIYLV